MPRDWRFDVREPIRGSNERVRPYSITLPGSVPVSSNEVSASCSAARGSRVMFLKVLRTTWPVSPTSSPLLRSKHWEGFAPYVTARLPQLERLDGREITRADRIRAHQRLPSLQRELATLAEEVGLCSGSRDCSRSRGKALAAWGQATYRDLGTAQKAWCYCRRLPLIR